MILSSPADVLNTDALTFGRSDRLAFALSTYLPGTGRSGQEDLAEHFVEKVFEDDLEDFAFEVERVSLSWGSCFIFLLYLIKDLIGNIMKAGGENDFLLFREARLRKKVIRLATLSNILALRR